MKHSILKNSTLRIPRIADRFSTPEKSPFFKRKKSKGKFRFAKKSNSMPYCIVQIMDAIEERSISKRKSMRPSEKNQSNIHPAFKSQK